MPFGPYGTIVSGRESPQGKHVAKEKKDTQAKY